MAAIAVASPLGAYQREASRLTPVVPQVSGKVVNRQAGVSLGPFSVRFSATDYEFDLTGVTAQSSFTDALHAAATTAQLAETPALDAAPAPNAYTRRQAMAGYSAAASSATNAAYAVPAMLSLRV